ncbi:MAG: hypothetical protein M9905_04245 [Rhizobiaceae bacterium]|nr:hypothetical protein [Rhizobiaceae bacterium]
MSIASADQQRHADIDPQHARKQGLKPSAAMPATMADASTSSGGPAA